MASAPRFRLDIPAGLRLCCRVVPPAREWLPRSIKDSLILGVREIGNRTRGQLIC